MGSSERTHPRLRPVRGRPADVAAALRAWWEAPDGPLAVRTSGSTGRPRDVLLSQPALAASVTATHRRLGGPAAWVLALPVTFVGGLQVLVRSLVAGTRPVVLDDQGGDWAAALDAAAEAAAAAGLRQRCTALVPTQLHRLDRAGALGVLAGLDAVLVGGGPADPGLLARARDHGVRVVTTYGMAETCGGCVYDGTALDGVAVRVAGDGRVLVAGPVLFDGYAGDPGATAEALVDGWLRTDDHGRIGPDGRLEVLGRVDDVVLSGGVSVPLPAVERALRSHPAVVDATATGVTDPEWGSRVVAVVVTSAGPGPSLADLRDHVSATVPRAWAPRDLVRVDALPLLASGKTDRLAVRALVEARPPGA